MKTNIKRLEKGVKQIAYLVLPVIVILFIAHSCAQDGSAPPPDIVEHAASPVEVGMEDTTTYLWDTIVREPDPITEYIAIPYSIPDFTDTKDITVPINPMGMIAYYCEREMREEHTYDVIVALSSQEAEEVVREAITSSIEADRNHEAAMDAQSSISTEPLRIADEMTVELLDPAGDKFKIVPIHTTPTQSLKDGAVPEWKWKVTPKEGSCCKAELTVMVTVAGETSSQTFTIKVLLKENLFSSFKKAVIDDPKWLVSVIIIPLLTFFVGVWRGRRKKKVKENE